MLISHIMQEPLSGALTFYSFFLMTRLYILLVNGETLLITSHIKCIVAS